MGRLASVKGEEALTPHHGLAEADSAQQPLLQTQALLLSRSTCQPVPAPPGIVQGRPALEGLQGCSCWGQELDLIQAGPHPPAPQTHGVLFDRL